MKGSRLSQVGPITIGCMSEEASDLLDTLVEKFEEEQGKSVMDVSGYQTLYWACRWSGLIRSSCQKAIENGED